MNNLKENIKTKETFYVTSSIYETHFKVWYDKPYESFVVSKSDEDVYTTDSKKELFNFLKKHNFELVEG